jgi:hypothetical protein
VSFPENNGVFMIRAFGFSELRLGFSALALDWITSFSKRDRLP